MANCIYICTKSNMSYLATIADTIYKKTLHSDIQYFQLCCTQLTLANIIKHTPKPKPHGLLYLTTLLSYLQPCCSVQL